MRQTVGTKSVPTLLILLTTLFITACFPHYNWRTVQGEAPPGVARYTVLMPGKPSTLSRDIQLGQNKVTMHMTAVQIDGVRFAVGAVQMADATQARLAVTWMKEALLNNIHGKLQQEKTNAATINGKLMVSDAFRAQNADASITMAGRLIASDDWAYELLVVGSMQSVHQEYVDTFLNSFVPI